MPTTLIADRPIEVNSEGFLTNYDQWDEELGAVLAKMIGIEMTDEHWAVIRFLREDYVGRNETATLRRTATVGGFEIKRLFQLFPSKPAKKMSYVAGLPKPKGCV
ncbi:MAG: TusE/DsrC/DsvC family sulfur relay protein [Actinomycetia bacterium]|nr:TusE/DsrC/DsvC family sulfur relay protein [Actinomycetes bacterium]